MAAIAIPIASAKRFLSHNVPAWQVLIPEEHKRQTKFLVPDSSFSKT